ncbi:hypothetical protein [Acinetobacter phage ABPH49]|nr:hypothetical protein [Acinetobacter phage ABPH49]
MGANGTELSNKLGSMFWTEEMPYSNNIALEYGSNQMFDHYGAPGVANPYVRIVGKSNSTDASTLSRAIRYYWVTDANRRPRTGKFIVGARTLRSLGSANKSGPLAWIYAKRDTDSGLMWLPGPSTNQPSVYVEVEIDWENLKAKMYYDGVEVISYNLHPEKYVVEITIGSRYLQAAGSGSYLPSVNWDQRIEFSDIYSVHDVPGEENPVGRLGAIRMVYTRVGVGSDWGPALASSEWSAFSTSLKKGADPKTYAAENIAGLIPSGWEVIGQTLETSGRRSDASTPATMEATVNYNSADLSKINIPLGSTATKGNRSVMFSPGILDLTKMSVTYKVNS